MENMAPDINLAIGNTHTTHGSTAFVGVFKDCTLNAAPQMDQCLADLRSTDPRADKKRIEQTKGGLLQDSFRWILDNPEFRRWRDDETSRLLWIRGDPGKGKTMLLCGIVDELGQSSAGGTVLSYFFCQATDDRLNSAAAVLRNLIYLLVDQQPSLISHVRKKYDHAGRQLFTDVNAWVSLSGIFEDILRDPALTAAYVIVDALDECVSGLTELLQLVVRSVSISPRVKWIISSRNWPSIESLLSSSDGTQLSLEVNADLVSLAVDAYISYKISQLESIKDDKKLQDQVRLQMREKANATFLWVALVFPELQRLDKAEYEDRKDILDSLEAMPSDLTQLYSRMMRQIAFLLGGDPERCYAILSTAALAYRPLSLLELPILAGFEGNLRETSTLKRLVSKCGSFLTVRDGIVYFIHQSANEYLTTSQEAQPIIFPSGPKGVHRDIFHRSLQAMTGKLRRNIYTLDHPGILISDASAPAPDPLAAVRYSCVYWIAHLCEAHAQHSSSLNDDDTIAVSDFLSQHLLHWLEALSLLRAILDGVPPIARLESLLITEPREGSTAAAYQMSRSGVGSMAPSYPRRILWRAKLDWMRRSATLHALFRRMQEGQRPAESLLIPQSPKHHLFHLVQDIRRFILYAGWVVENAPLQTYLSALLFSPAQSLTRRMFAKEEPTWIKTKPVIKSDWSSCLQTLEGHSGSVYSVAFSADSKLVASGSSDNTVKIWDTATGKEVRTLEGHNRSVLSVAFSANSKLVASGSYDKAIKIWDAATGKEVRTLEGHSGSVYSVAFSAHSKLVASGSRDNTVKIWDAATGKEVRTLEGHNDLVRSVAFSADSKLVALGSGDNTVKIWDAATGKEIRTLEGHNDWVLSVAFSADSKLVASGSGDNTVKIWDAATGKEVATLEVGTSLDTLSFDATSSCLLTDIGPIRLNAEPSDMSAGAQGLAPFQHPAPEGYGLNSDRSWISWNGNNVLWLPPDYRSSVSAVSSLSIAIGCRSGRVMIIGFLGAPVL